MESDESENDKDDFENILKELSNMNKIRSGHFKDTFNQTSLPIYL